MIFRPTVDRAVLPLVSHTHFRSFPQAITHKLKTTRTFAGDASNSKSCHISPQVSYDHEDLLLMVITTINTINTINAINTINTITPSPPSGV